MIGLDTNVLVRYFAQDDARQSPIATRFIERTLSELEPGHVSLVVLAELAWVLRRNYGADVMDVVGAVMQLLCDPRFAVQARPQVWSALDVYRPGSADFADALIAALNREAGCSQTVTFDVKAARIPSVVLLK